MRGIGTRLSLVLAIAIAVVIGCVELVRSRENTEMLIESSTRDHQLTGELLRSMLEGEPASTALPMVRRLSENPAFGGAHVDIATINAEQARVELGATEALRSGRVVVTEKDGDFRTFVPTEDPNSIVVLHESSADLRDFLDASLYGAERTAAILVLVLVVLIAFLTHRLVTQPIRQVTEAAQRVGSGDLSYRIDAKGEGELATFAREMNSMSDSLAEARQRAEGAEAERISMLEQLRHADRLRTVGQMASVLAHELGTPLNVIVGRSRLILDDATVPDGPRDCARICGEQAKRMTGIIRQVLDYARRAPQTRAAVDANKLARESIAMLDPMLRRRKVEVEIELPPDPVAITADASQVLQVLTNLVVNAAQAMPTGGVLGIRVSSATRRLPEELGSVTRALASIEVRDHGPGIPESERKKLFEPFYTTKQEGTGLGLSVVRGIVREHGGYVEVESELGVGTTFRCYFPLAAQPEIEPVSALAS